MDALLHFRYKTAIGIGFCKLTDSEEGKYNEIGDKLMSMLFIYLFTKYDKWRLFDRLRQELKKRTQFVNKKVQDNARIYNCAFSVPKIVKLKFEH